MRGLTGDELLRLRVRVRGIELGRPVDLLLHPAEPRALGVDVLCGDDKHRFLPLVAATVGEGELEAGSALVLLDLRADSFYRRASRSLNSLRGARLPNGQTLRDLVLGEDWSVVELVLDGDRRVPLDGLLLPARRLR